MKSLLSVLLICITTLASAWTIQWTGNTNQPVLSYYAPGTNQAYKLYGTQTLGTPVTNYTLLATWTNWIVVTNAGVVQYRQTVPVTNVPFFFTMTSSNITGESFFSAIALTGPALEQFSISGLSQP